MQRRTLPNSLSGLLAAAISDSKAISRRHYLPYYGYWHRPSENGRCEICLAGASIVQRLRFPHQTKVHFGLLSRRVQNKIESLNAMRRGAWAYAYQLLHQRSPAPETQLRLDALPAPDHGCFVGWPQFNAHIRSLQRILPKLREIERLDRAGS